MATATTLPPALAALARQRSIDVGPWQAHGRLDLRIDDLPRVRLRRGRRDDSILVEARLTALPQSEREREREQLLTRLMLCVTAGAARQVGTLALSADGERVLLQAELDGLQPDAFNTAFEAYLDEVDYWRVVLRMCRR